jgi:hypothetical protein
MLEVWIVYDMKTDKRVKIYNREYDAHKYVNKSYRVNWNYYRSAVIVPNSTKYFGGEPYAGS